MLPRAQQAGRWGVHFVQDPIYVRQWWSHRRIRGIAWALLLLLLIMFVVVAVLAVVAVLPFLILFLFLFSSALMVLFIQQPREILPMHVDRLIQKRRCHVTLQVAGSTVRYRIVLVVGTFNTVTAHIVHRVARVSGSVHVQPLAR